MSIYDNILAGNRLNARRMKKSQADDIVEKSLKGANLWNEVKDRLGKPGMGLSGGQQQRLCIAPRIAVEPQVLLMDEPCSALDPISTSAIEDLIHELKTDYTIVIVTHNMQQAARVSDETGFFNLKATGEPGQLVSSTPPRRSSPTPTSLHRGLHLRPLRLSPAPPGSRHPGDSADRPVVVAPRPRAGGAAATVSSSRRPGVGRHHAFVGGPPGRGRD